MTNFNDIPQVKFDTMEAQIEKSLKGNIKNLKVHYIDIQDFKNIESISTELWDWNIIWWYNSNWKSSFVEGILAAILWQKFYWNWKVSPASLVRQWQDEAIVNLWIKWEQNEIILRRVFTKWTIKKPTWDTKIEASMNGQKIAQKTLDELLNSLTIDPLKLWQLSISEQIQEIKATTWLDTSDIDNKIKSQEEQTKETRAYAKQSKNVYDDFISSWVPEEVEEKTIWDLLEKRKLFEELKSKTQEYNSVNNNILSIEEQIKQLQDRLEKEKQQLEKIKQEWIILKNKIKEAWLTSLDDLDNQINEIEEHNNKSKKYKEYLNKKQHYLNCDKDLKQDEKKLEELRSERNLLIANSNLPKYMELSEELWIIVDWIEYKLLNTARKIEVAIDLVLISWSPLRLIRIEQGWELDVKTLEKVKQKILDNNFQIFLERPILDKFDTIIINDWELVEDKENFIKNN